MKNKILVGKSGRRYQFVHHSLGSDCPAVPGVYAFFSPAADEQEQDETQFLGDWSASVSVSPERFLGMSANLNSDLGSGFLTSDAGREWARRPSDNTYFTVSDAGAVGAAAIYSDLIGGSDRDDDT